jgi:hypothetical protein
VHESRISQAAALLGFCEHWPRKLSAYLRIALESLASESLCAFTLFEVLRTLVVAKQLSPAQRFVAIVAVSDRQQFEPCLCS